MSNGISDELQFIPPEVIAGFGGVAPSLLVPYFQVITTHVNQLVTGTGLKLVGGNSDRYSITFQQWLVGNIGLGNIETSILNECPFSLNGLEHLTLSFADYGGWVCQEWWAAQSGTVDVVITEIIYRPKRCK